MHKLVQIKLCFLYQFCFRRMCAGGRGGRHGWRTKSKLNSFIWVVISNETLEVEPEEEVDTDEKGPYILQGEVEKPIKEMRNRMATGDDDVPGDVLKILGEGGLKILTKLMNTLYETGQ